MNGQDTGSIGTVMFDDLGFPIKQLLMEMQGCDDEALMMLRWISVKDVAHVFDKQAQDIAAEIIWNDLKKTLHARKEAALAADPVAQVSDTSALAVSIVASEECTRQQEQLGLNVDKAMSGEDNPIPEVEYGVQTLGYGALELGYAAPEIGCGAPEVGYGAVELGYAAPELGYAAPEFGHAAPELGYRAPSLGYEWLDEAVLDDSGNNEDGPPLRHLRPIGSLMVRIGSFLRSEKRQKPRCQGAGARELPHKLPNPNHEKFKRDVELMEASMLNTFVQVETAKRSAILDLEATEYLCLVWEECFSAASSAIKLLSDEEDRERCQLYNVLSLAAAELHARTQILLDESVEAEQCGRADILMCEKAIAVDWDLKFEWEDLGEGNCVDMLPALLTYESTARSTLLQDEQAAWHDLQRFRPLTAGWRLLKSFRLSFRKPTAPTRRESQTVLQSARRPSPCH
jgi:hypothetical protein